MASQQRDTPPSGAAALDTATSAPAQPKTSGLDGYWGDWGKRLSESTQAIQSDLMQKVDEIQKTVQDGATPPAAPLTAAAAQTAALVAENQKLKSELERARQPSDHTPSSDPAPAIEPSAGGSLNPDVQTSAKIVQLEMSLAQAADREVELRDDARTQINDLKAENEATKKLLAEQVANTVRVVDAAEPADAPGSASAATAIVDSAPDLASESTQDQASIPKETARLIELEAQLAEKDRALQTLDGKATATEEELRKKVSLLEQSLEQSLAAETNDIGETSRDTEDQLEIQNLRDKLAALGNVQAEREQLKKTNTELARKVADLSRKQETSRSQQAVLSENLGRVTKEKDTASVQLKTLQAQVGSLTADLAKSQQSFAAARKRLLSAEEGANRAEKAALDLKKQLDVSGTRSKGVDKKLAEKDALLEDMSLTLKSFQEELDSSHKRLTDAGAKGSSIEQELRQRMKQAEEDERAANDAFRATESRNVSMSEELDRAMKTLDDKASTVETLELEVAQERRRRDEAFTELSAVRQEYATYKDRVVAAVGQREEANRALDYQLREAKRKLDSLSTPDSPTQSLLVRAEVAEAQISSLKKELEELRTNDEQKQRDDAAGSFKSDPKASSLEKNMVDTSLALDAERTTSAKLYTELCEAKVNLEEAKQELTSCQGAQADLQEKHEQDLAVVSAKVSSLQRELRRARPDSSFVAGGITGGPRQSPTTLMPLTPALGEEYKLRAEQLEKQVWQLRKEVTRVTLRLQELRDKNDTVGSLMSL